MRLEQCRPMVIGLLMLMTCIFATSGYVNRMLRYEKMPKSANLDGLGCALEKQTIARGVKVNVHTKDCVSLTESWFATQTQEANYTYFKLLMLEEPFSSTAIVGQWLPSTFVVGSSVVMYIKTEEIKQLLTLNIQFRNKATEGMITMLFRADFTTYGAAVVIMNALIDSRGWLSEEILTNPFKNSYTEYKVEFVLTETHTEVIVDGSSFYSFGHKTSISNYKWVEFNGSKLMTCQRIQFLNAV